MKEATANGIMRDEILEYLFMATLSWPGRRARHRDGLRPPHADSHSERVLGERRTRAGRSRHRRMPTSGQRRTSSNRALAPGLSRGDGGASEWSRNWNGRPPTTGGHSQPASRRTMPDLARIRSTRLALMSYLIRTECMRLTSIRQS